MELIKKISISLLFLVAINKFSNAQFFFLDNAQDQIEVEFLKQKIETSPNTTFFNVLKIKNPSQQHVSFITNFSYPATWSFMGEKNQQLSLAPNDSIFIPFRAAASIDAKGEIGYAIVASLTDLKGVPFKNKYSFVNIPKQMDVKFMPMNRLAYLDQLTKEANVELYFSNNGNTDEIFYVNLILENSITSRGEQDGFLKKEISIAPQEDTLVKIPISLKADYDGIDRKFHRINIKANSADTTFSTSVWIKELESGFFNHVPDNYRMLSVELSAQNLFSQAKPSFSINLEGNLLFKHQGDLFYSLNSYGNKFYNEPWKYGRYIVQYKRKNINIKAGDISGDYVQDMYGRGVLTEISIKKKNILKSIYTTSMFIDKNNMGLIYQRIFPSGYAEISGSYVENRTQKVSSTGSSLSGTIKTKKFGSFAPILAASLAEWDYGESTKQLGLMGGLHYSGKFNRTFVNMRTRYADRYYFGKNEGRYELSGNVTYFMPDNIDHFRFYYNMAKSSPSAYFQNNLLFGTINTYEESRITYNQPFNKSIFLSYGLMSEMRYGNNFYNYTPTANLKTRNALTYGSLRFRVPNSQNLLSFTLKSGMNYISSYSSKYIQVENKKPWFSLVANLNYRTRKWGFFGSYYHGPATISQQLAYLTLNYNSRNIRLLPYWDLFLIPNFLKLYIKPNFIYDIPAKTSRLNMGTDLIAYPGRTWKITFSNALSYSSTVDKLTDEKFTYTGTYFELRVKKDFNINQPRYQYHDLKVYFFKDLNGNRVKDPDEPGIRDIMFNIKVDEDKLIGQENTTSGYFMEVDLLSDMDGYIHYDNVPNGFYIIEYNAIGKMQGSFSSETNSQKLYIGKDETLYIPFFENNKIFGKAIINRSKLSNLGIIDPSNIKVTAEDSRGHKFSSLTDGNGDFSIYVPSVDKYTVKINNIFFENFELEQNNYEVQLNGYRQFEVNFIFNEKRRRINFAADYDYGSRLDAPGVEIVRRTNLSGTVKDATTLQPIQAEIRVVNESGQEITSAQSNSKTGVFATSFIAGDNYAVEATSDDYWYHAEKLYSQQIVTFSNLKKEILLKAITVGSFIPMNTLNFEEGSYEIPPTAFPELERLLLVLKKNPTVKISVHGHADDMEIQGTDVDLALERAKLVAKYLIANGYNRIKYVGFSNTKPIADNETEDGRKQNRRVEIVVTGK